MKKLVTFIISFVVLTTTFGISFAKDISNIQFSKSQLCQEGFEPYDIIINNKKIGGNAQKRTKEVIFQHGSIPIKSSPYYDATTLENLGISIDYQKAQELLIKTFSKTFNVKFQHSQKGLKNAS